MNITFKKEILETSFLDPRQNFDKYTQKSEVRYDPLTGRTSHIAHLGVIKPQPLDLDELDSKEVRARCPFCPDKRKQFTPKFLPDTFPAERLERGEALVVPNIAPYDSVSAVTIITGQHIVPLEDFTAKRISDAVGASLEFLQIVQGKRPELPYKLLCWNYMPPSGSGLIHPHMQAFATRFPGNLYQNEFDAARKYCRETRRIYWQDLIDAEKRAQERYLGCTGRAHWLSAFAPLGMIGEIIGIFPDVYALEDFTSDVLEESTDAFMRIFEYFKKQGISSLNASICFGPQEEKFFPAYWRVIPRTYLNLHEKPADANFFQMLLREPISTVWPEDFCRAVKPFFEE